MRYRAWSILALLIVFTTFAAPTISPVNVSESLAVQEGSPPYVLNVSKQDKTVEVVYICSPCSDTSVAMQYQNTFPIIRISGTEVVVQPDQPTKFPNKALAVGMWMTDKVNTGLQGHFPLQGTYG